jgi:adenosylcobyric acid synthase
VINKFRGQKELLDSGIKWLEEKTQVPVLGVIPWSDQPFPAEDSLDLLERNRRQSSQDINISVIRLPRIANFTDFDPLEAESTVAVNYVDIQDSLGHPDAVIIPGTKTTIADLLALERSGMAEQIRNYAAAGGTVLGICGGYQILGQRIIDPEGLEGEAGEYNALNLLPVTTILSPNKVARQRQVTSQFPQPGLPVDGYEIHQGRTRVSRSLKDDPNQYQPIFDDAGLGLVDKSQSIWGCYLHGLFDNGAWRRSWINQLRKQRGMSSLATGISNYRDQRESTLNNLAELVEKNLDLKGFLSNYL